jgi:hypothetical protein
LLKTFPKASLTKEESLYIFSWYFGLPGNHSERVTQSPGRIPVVLLTLLTGEGLVQIIRIRSIVNGTGK